jgi:hypothetical protein
LVEGRRRRRRRRRRLSVNCKKQRFCGFILWFFLFWFVLFPFFFLFLFLFFLFSFPAAAGRHSSCAVLGNPLLNRNFSCGVVVGCGFVVLQNSCDFVSVPPRAGRLLQWTAPVRSYAPGKLTTASSRLRQYLAACVT